MAITLADIVELFGDRKFIIRRDGAGVPQWMAYADDRCGSVEWTFDNNRAMIVTGERWVRICISSGYGLHMVDHLDFDDECEVESN